MAYEFDYKKLRGIIRERFSTQANFAQAIGLSATSLSAKLNCRTEFGQEEMKKAAEVLRILPEEMSFYFFTPKVQEN